MVNIYCYSKELDKLVDLTIHQLSSKLKDKDYSFWVDFEAPSDEEIEYLDSIFGFHPLAIEDCVTENLAPKLDDFKSYLFLIVYEAGFDQSTGNLAMRELGLFLGENFLVSYHRLPAVSVEKIKTELSATPDLISKGVDWIVHSILDSLLDKFVLISENLADRVYNVESDVFASLDRKALSAILTLRRDVFHLSRIIEPQMLIIDKLSKENTFVREETRIYFRDIYDHMVQIFRLSHSHHELVTDSLNVYFSLVQNDINKTIKTLTVIATVVTPLLLITGIYGMNFRHMPELEWDYGYFAILLIMVLLSIVTVLYFKKKSWI